MNQSQRVDKLERQVDAPEGGGDLVVLLWPEQEQDRAELEGCARSCFASVEVRPGALYWPDGTEAVLP